MLWKVLSLCFYFLLFFAQSMTPKKTQQMMQMGQVQHIPKVETLDNIIKNQQNLTQGN